MSRWRREPRDDGGKPRAPVDRRRLRSRRDRCCVARLRVCGAMNSQHTPGPWGWFGNKHGFYLATERGGRIYVMDFVRMGMNRAQPRFQVRVDGKHGVMTEASELCTFEVADNVVGMKAAAQPGSGVYRTDINGFDHPDARVIAAAAQLLEALMLMVERAPSMDGEAVDKARRALVAAGVQL
jgi:hypothetical protein